MPQQQVPQLTWQEGTALGVLDTLLGAAHPKVIPSGYDASTVAPDDPSPFLDVARQRVVRRCLWHLTHRGGARQTPVLRDGRRTEGSLFDAPVNDGFAFHFGTLTDRFVRHALPKLPEFMSRAQSGDWETKRGHRWVKGTLKGRTQRSGDWLFFGLVQSNLHNLALPPATHGALRSRLSMVSPMAALLALNPRAEGTSLESLLHPRAVRLVECLGGWIQPHWRSEILGAELPRLVEIHVALSSWLEALDAHHRLDLVGPLLGALQDVARRWMASSDLRRTVRRRTTNNREADQLCHAVADLFALIPAIHRHQRTLQQQGYGGDRYDESQLCTEVVETVADPQLPMDAAIASLRGRIG